MMRHRDGEQASADDVEYVNRVVTVVVREVGTAARLVYPGFSQRVRPYRAANRPPVRVEWAEPMMANQGGMVPHTRSERRPGSYAERHSSNRTRESDRPPQIGGLRFCCVVLVAVCVGAIVSRHGSGRAQSNSEDAAAALNPPTLAEAQALFYNGRYETAAAATRALRLPDTEDLASYELRSSALLFQLRVLLEGRGREDALKDCATCPNLITEFLADVHRGQDLARGTLKSSPDDEASLFFLGKLDLNYVWLQLGPLRRKTGWNEYWEARRSLDAVLKHNPQHVRAKVARAWIDYIVDTRMPWGTRWLLGGGNRDQALADMRAAADMESDFFTHAEAEFGLWDMYVRERDIARATVVARRLAHDFPDNRRLAAFLEDPATHSER
jgi:hypothetical protein